MFDFCKNERYFVDYEDAFDYIRDMIDISSIICKQIDITKIKDVIDNMIIADD